MFKRIRRIKTLREFWGYLLMYINPNWMSDRLHLEMTWLIVKHQHLDLDHPKTFNEKLQWLKLYDRNPEYAIMVDKCKAKNWVAEKIGEQYIIPTLAEYLTADEIDLDKLPNQFVLKCNHDSGSVVICKDKATFDLEAAKKKLTQCLATDTSAQFGEWAYRNVPRRILAEKYMEEDGQLDLMDYKWFCFDGVPRIMYMSRDHAEDARTDFFDMAFNRLPMRMQAPNSDVAPEKPKQFDEMKRIAEILSAGIPHVRVDLYVINGKIYFGEMTFYHCGGMVDVKPYEWNMKMGDMIKLPAKRPSSEKVDHRRF